MMLGDKDPQILRFLRQDFGVRVKLLKIWSGNEL
jgi:hypothetical protein